MAPKFATGGAAAAALVTKSCPTLTTPCTVARQAPLRDSPGKNTGVGCHYIL